MKTPLIKIDGDYDVTVHSSPNTPSPVLLGDIIAPSLEGVKEEARKLALRRERLGRLAISCNNGGGTLMIRV